MGPSCTPKQEVALPLDFKPQVCMLSHLVTSDGSSAGSQASSRGEANDSALLSIRYAGLLEPPERSRAHAGSREWAELLQHMARPAGPPRDSRPSSTQGLAIHRT